jgi:hypothetical protein
VSETVDVPVALLGYGTVGSAVERLLERVPGPRRPPSGDLVVPDSGRPGA